MIKFLIVTTIRCFGENPKAGATGAGGGFGLGLLIKAITPETMDIVTFIFQNLAFLGAIIASIITIIGWAQKQRKNKVQ